METKNTSGVSLLILLLALTASASGWPSSAARCDFFPDSSGPSERLPPRYRSGVDLAEELIEGTQESSARVHLGIVAPSFHAVALPLPPVSLAREPRCLSRRGNEIANRLVGSTSAFPFFDFRWLAAQSGCAAPGESQAEVIREMTAARPGITALALELRDDPEVARALAELAKTGTLIVLAAGNQFPRPMPASLGEIPALRFTTLSPSGFIALQSSQGTEVDIAVPSSDDPEATFVLAVQAVGLLSAWLPGIRMNEVKALVRNSAIRTINSREAVPHNGAGLLNFYALAEIALALRARHWPAARETILDETSYFYDFRIKGKELLEAAARLEGSAGCSSRRTQINLLRKAFFLTRTELSRKALERVYDREGLADESNFLRGIGPNYAAWVQSYFVDSNFTPSRLEAIRAAAGLGKMEWVDGFFSSAIGILRDSGQPISAELADCVVTAMASLHDRNFSLGAWGALGTRASEWFLAEASRMGRRDFAVQAIRFGAVRDFDILPAVRAGQLSMVEFLLERGSYADRKAWATKGLGVAVTTPLGRAMGSLLLSRGADVNSVSSSGVTPLFSAARRGDIGVVKLLMESGGNPEIQVQGNQSVWDLANENSNLMQMLCEHAKASAQCEIYLAGSKISKPAGPLYSKLN